MDTDFLVIGAGFGGLGAALTLAEAGRRVTLCERLNYPGGCAGTFKRKGIAFEAGATLFSGLDDNQLFGRWRQQHKMDFQVEWLNPAIRFISSAGALDIGLNKASVISQIVASAPEKESSIREFFEAQGKVADGVWQLLERPEQIPPLNWKGLLKNAQWASGRLDLFKYVNKSLGEVLIDFGVRDVPLLRELCNGACQITVQTSADRAEALWALAILDFFFRGTGHIKGGIGALAHALVKAIQDAGGQVNYTDGVRSLTPHGSGWKVKTRRGEYIVKHVISNLLPHDTWRLIEPSPPMPAWIEKKEKAIEAGWGAVMRYGVLPGHADMPQEAFHYQLVHDANAPLQEGNHFLISVNDVSNSNLLENGQRTFTLSTHVPLQKYWSLPEPERGVYVNEVQANIDATLVHRAPVWLQKPEWWMSGSPRTFVKYTGRHRGAVGGIPKTKGLSNYPLFPKTEIAPGLWGVGDSYFPGQSTYSTALSGVKVAQSLLG